MSEAPDRARVEALLRAYGGDMDAGPVFLGEKDLYRYQVEGEDMCALQLRTAQDRVIFMGEPMGNTDHADDCVKEFIREADAPGYETVFYEVPGS